MTTAHEPSEDDLRGPDRHGVYRQLDRLGDSRHGRGRLRGGGARLARAELRHPVVDLRSAPDGPHESRAVRLRRFGPDRHVVLQRAAHVARAAASRRGSPGSCSTRGRFTIVLGAWSMLAGWNTSKEYAELEWPFDIAIAVVWVAYGVVFFGTIARRKVGPIYISNWFYGALIIVIAMLHIVNNLELPATLCKSYSLFAGRAGRDRGVVVRPQRGRIPVDRRLPRDALLLPAEAGRAADLELPAVDRRVLGVRLQLHLGRPAPSALQRVPGVGAVARRRHESRAARAFVGDDDQRRDDGRERVAQIASRSRDSSSSCSHSRSTGSRRSKARCSRSAA